MHPFPPDWIMDAAGADQGGRPAQRGGTRGGRPAGESGIVGGWDGRWKEAIANGHHGQPADVIPSVCPTQSNSQPNPRQALSVACKREHAACWPVVHLTSSRAGLGVAELREALAALMLHDV